MDILKKVTELVKKYRYAALVILAGVVLMLLPSHQNQKQTQQPAAVEKATLSSELSAILSQIHGVGKAQVLLALAEGEKTLYHYDEQGDRKEIVIITGSDRGEQGLISQVVPPKYRGAVIVCQGGDDPVVRLQVIEAVSKLTGLGSDRISVLKMK